MSAGIGQYGPQRERATTPTLGGRNAASGGANKTPLSPSYLAAPYAGDTYYAVPPIKPGHYGWLITAYFFIGGLASAAQFIATIADLVAGKRDRGIVRAGRYIALLGALASPVLLIADLHTPRRWFNMIRIYRGTSAMSIGSWALSTFGVFSGLAAVAQILEDLGVGAGVWLGRLAQLPAAIAGAVVALYTGTLLAATNLPFVSAAFPFLSSLFSSSAASTAAAALSLAAEATGAPRATKRSLNLVALASGVSELIFALLVRDRWRKSGAEATLLEGGLGTAYHVGVLGFGIAGPLAVHAAEAVAEAAAGRRSGLASVLASLSALAGGFILRAVFVFGANRSGEKAEEYFQMTQPRGEE